MYRFARPEMFNGLWILLIFVVFFFFYYRYRLRFIKTHFNDNTLFYAIRDFAKNKLIWKFFLFSLAWIFLIIALANPQAGIRINKQVKAYGADVVLVVDISNSMLAEDVKPSRLKKAQQILLGLLEKSGSDKFALIPFAGNAFLQLPMTIDQTLLRNFIQLLSPEMITRQGTNLEEGLRVAMDAIDSSRSTSPVVVLLSDGENLEGDLLNIISEYKRKNIPVHTVAVGTRRGAPIPIYQNGSNVGYKKDEFGNVIITKPDEETLKSIADATGGIFVGTEDLSQAVQLLRKAIDKAKKSESQLMDFADYRSIFEWPLVVALLLLLLELFVSDKRVKWQFQLKQFIEKGLKS